MGHIHRQTERNFRSDGEQRSILILGTPYTTNFGESGKDNYYGVIEDGELILHKINHGPRHLVIKNKDVLKSIKKINNKNYYTFLRIVLDAGEALVDIEDITAPSVEIKYAPAFDEEDVSNYNPSRDLFRLNEVVIEDYINSANSSIEKNKLMEGYNLLKYED